MNLSDENTSRSATVEEQAREELSAFFEERKDEVFYSRQVEVLYEGEFFHWITNRIIRELIESGLLLSEERNLSSGGSIKVFWHKLNRYCKRKAAKIIALVEEYAGQDNLPRWGSTEK